MKMHQSTTPRRGLSEAEAADYIGISRSSLRQGRMDGKREKRMPPPPFARLGRKIVYLIDDLDTWLESNRQIIGDGMSNLHFTDKEIMMRGAK